ncbi:uncharacterized protein FTJAE_3684 [Fusarium tjaetaba]|uniref:Uncharacterized protein n=1 Tax=Fusarium tjaetaba TaxID=1567544 RepID=A0A8H5VYR3_9HYPO|nr:uncharacterized protein FTJAE_3684 [Fusarium tjaetaba]KAF5642527.1 hypothetical protein FTJAE_3684 [Fusarium tjaetaba]
MRIFKPTHPPTNRQAWGMALDNEGNTLDARTLSADQVKLYFRVMIQTMAHRAVLRGTGFYEVLSQDRTGLSIGSLPSMCYRLYDDRYLMQCITEEAGYHDLQRFREYLLGRELNIGLIIGPSGSGTTTLGAAAALSLAYWFLVVMRTSALPPLDQDSKPGLVKLQAEIDTRPDMLHLRQWVTRQMDPATYAATATPIINIKDVFFQVMRQADFLCVHPADTEISPISQWKSTIARGVVIGEAGSMSQADFYGLWGNSLLPCFLFGDPDQKPVVLTTDEADADGNLYNRFAADGAVSPLKYLMATGIPAFRLEAAARP